MYDKRCRDLLSYFTFHMTILFGYAASHVLVNACRRRRVRFRRRMLSWFRRFPVADPNSLESGSDRPELTIDVLPHSGNVSACMLDSKLPDAESFSQALEAATNGAKQIFSALQFELRNHSLGLLKRLVAL